ncbi:cyclin-D4-2-like [Mercurialis annua]|uniref:cyclin-D4-2-like n=1 Tax=Mercurialis annua TaxID=3986 RepID=UPI00215EBE75|nr:cyclin-D4-2-like [Mercurialis annua]
MAEQFNHCYDDSEVEEFFQKECQCLSVQAFNDPNIHLLRPNFASFFAQFCGSYMYRSRIIRFGNKSQFDASIPYMAMNYLDEFISKHELPTLGDTDVAYRSRVLAVACLCIAWKMMTRGFKNAVLSTNFPDLRIELKDLNRVEKMVLRTIYAFRVNALCFVQYLLSLVAEPEMSLTPSIIQLIIQSQAEIKFTQFKCSVLAASAILVSCSAQIHSEYKEKFTGTRINMDQDKLNGCVQMLIEFRNNISGPSEIAPQNTSPEGKEEPSSSAEGAGKEAAKKEEELTRSFGLKWHTYYKNLDLEMEESLLPWASEDEEPELQFDLDDLEDLSEFPID